MLSHDYVIQKLSVPKVAFFLFFKGLIFNKLIYCIKISTQTREVAGTCGKEHTERRRWPLFSWVLQVFPLPPEIQQPGIKMQRTHPIKICFLTFLSPLALPDDMQSPRLPCYVFLVCCFALCYRSASRLGSVRTPSTPQKRPGNALGGR